MRLTEAELKGTTTVQVPLEPLITGSRASDPIQDGDMVGFRRHRRQPVARGRRHLALASQDSPGLIRGNNRLPTLPELSFPIAGIRGAAYRQRDVLQSAGLLRPLRRIVIVGTPAEE